MRKCILLAAFAVAMTSNVNAQDGLVGNKLGDNIYVSVNAGGTSFPGRRDFFKNLRPTFGLELGKQFSPYIGASLSAMTKYNTSDSRNFVDQFDLSALAKFNLTNIFLGYNGVPRVFELEIYGGPGFARAFWPDFQRADENAFYGRTGLSFNFNLGEERKWTFSLKPGFAFSGKDVSGLRSWVKNSNAELLASLTYHFMNSNGERYITFDKRASQSEIDRLNQEINQLRGQFNEKDQLLADQRNQIDDLKKKLSDCENQPKPQATTIVNNKTSLESVVNFRVGSASVSTDQIPNVERIANYLKKNNDATVVIKGYASPEGNKELNERLSLKRAEAVKNMLIKKYGISESRIVAEGAGIGNMFSDPDWNRVSIATINTEK